jgi:hypothetical protein
LRRPIEEPSEVKSEPQKQKQNKGSKTKSMPEFHRIQIARHAVKRAQRKIKRNSTTDFHFPNIFRESHSDEKTYRIEKVNLYHYEKFKTDRSKWKIYCRVDLYQVKNVIKDLIDGMLICLTLLDCKLVYTISLRINIHKSIYCGKMK